MSIFSPLELLGDRAHAAAELADAGALGVDRRVVRLHGDLGAVTGLAGERDDLDETGGDLGHLEREQLADESGVRARHRDLRALGALGDRGDVDAQAGAVGVLLAGDLLLGRQDRLDRAEVDVHHARVRALLHDAGDDVALLAAELAEHGVVGDVAQTLADDLLRGERGDAAEVVGGRLLLADDGALVVEQRDEDGDVAGLAVEVRACAFGKLAGVASCAWRRRSGSPAR